MINQTDVLSVIKLIRPFKCNFQKIRIGSLGDGGYVLPNDLEGIKNVLSIGVGEEVSFDIAFAEKNISVYQYDPTVESAPSSHSNCFFNKISWAPNDGEGKRTLETMLTHHNLGKTNDNILKFDTEGAEWDCIPSISNDILKFFRIIVCELHGLTSISNPEMLQKIRDTLLMLTRNHTVTHLHANNCCGISLIEGVPIPAVIELTLLRKDRSEFFLSEDDIPGALDYPNMPDRPDLVLSYI